MSKEKKEYYKTDYSKLKTQTKDVSPKMGKLPQLIEAFCEKFATNSQLVNSVDFLIIVPLSLTLFFNLWMLDKSLIPKDNKKKNAMVVSYILTVCFIVGSVVALVISRPKYEYRFYYFDIGGSKVFAVLMYIASAVVYFYGFKAFGMMYNPYVTIYGFTVTLALSLFSAMIKTQKATQLRFKPEGDNHRYTLINAVSMDTGSICVVESSAFKIRLMNAGTTTWDSANFKIHRHTGTGSKGTCVKFSLPHFTLEPEGKIDIVPETLKFEGKCIRIPRLHCFGVTDRFTEVRTFIVDGTTYVQSKLQDDSVKGCYCYEKKVAEFVVMYKDDKWLNASVCSGSDNSIV